MTTLFVLLYFATVLDASDVRGANPILILAEQNSGFQTAIPSPQSIITEWTYKVIVGEALGQIYYFLLSQLPNYITR